ncbi:thaumatin-like protein 1b [Zea mays]|nr:thaumatin-like protein 1b [Zea mays]AQK79397.1 Putative thaumatin domain family protein [Zea mays]|eukprot:XP_008650259.1 thaumatin-like protein 1b [Zea mays]
MARHSLALVLLVVIAISVTGVQSKMFTITNNCVHTVWPGISTGASPAPPLDTTGFELAPGESRALPVPSGWSGRVWGRTLCSTAAGTGKFTCVTGDCGSGLQECASGNAAPPVTLAQFSMDGSGGMDLYDVSLVDGYNLPMVVVRQGAAAEGNCVPAGCVVDLSGACPAELRVPGVVACKSACQAFGSPRYCCTGEYGNPDTCKPSAYSEFFKKACPRAYSYAYDGNTSTFGCSASDTGVYIITFCPSTSR